MKSSYPHSAIIVRLTSTNPRKPGTQGYDAWNLIRDGMTVGEYLAAHKATGAKIPALAHLDWDRGHGWSRFEGETPEAARANAGQYTPKPKPAPVTPVVPTPAPAPEVASAPAAADLAAAVDARLEATAEVPRRLTKAERKALARKVA